MASRPAAAIFGCFLLQASSAAATYSIVGADSRTREVGGTGTSCLGGGDVYIIYGSAPGLGVIHAQAQYSQRGRDRGVELLQAGAAPADIIAEITSASFDGNARVRQYGVVDATGRTAGFTGAGDGVFADDRQGAVGAFSYSVQGNILTSEAVLAQAAAAFEGSGCDLAERLMRALEAGADNGEGDSRCTSNGIPSDSSFIQVERPDTARGSYLELHVRTSGSESPIPGLREQFDAWRTTHPCPAAGGSGGNAGGGAGGGGGAGATGGAGTSGAPVGGSGGRASGGTGGVSAGQGGSVSGGAPSGGASAAGAGAPNAGTSGAPSGPAGAGAPADNTTDGCGCRSAKSASWGSVLLAAALFVFGALRRRRLA